MDIVTVMRVKNEARYLRYALDSLEPLGGPVVLLDDGSTDDTPKIAQAYEFVRYQRQDDMPMDEGRDRTAIFRAALGLSPAWIMSMDGDEVLDTAAPTRIRAAMERAPADVSVFELNLAIMASAPGDERQLWIPGETWNQPRICRVAAVDRGYKFASAFAGNLHCGCVPRVFSGRTERLNAWVKYYGYETPEAVETKRAFYAEHDPVHIKSMESQWKERGLSPRQAWHDGPDCREIGIHGTVMY